MIQVIDHDKFNIREVQKVTDRKGNLVRYQVAPIDLGDSTQVKVCATLAEARKLIGKS